MFIYRIHSIVCTGTYTQPLLEIVISILLHFDIYTHVDIANIKIVSKNRLCDTNRGGGTSFQRKTFETL